MDDLKARLAALFRDYAAALNQRRGDGPRLAEQLCAKKLARSAGASPAQVRPSEPPGSECCVS